MIMKAGFLICAVFLSLNGWCQEPEKSPVMSDAYWALWNDDVQRKIDEDIDRYRKADAAVAVSGAAVGTEITVEQMTHDFVFGANIFNFNQLGTAERNRRYKELFGDLFNSGTVRSEERRVGREWVRGVELGGRRIIKKKKIRNRNRAKGKI